MKRIIYIAITIAVASSLLHGVSAETLVSSLYEIVSGSYIECCGIGGDARSSLPNESQRFVRLTVDSQRHTASMTFLGEDRKTVFSIVPCPPAGEPIHFDFDFGLLFSNRIVFHVDPGPPPYGLYWNYTVSNSVDSLRLNGVVGTAQQQCVDVPTQFSHSNVVAVLMPPAGPRLTFLEFLTNHGARLLVQGQPGRTNVLEASTDLMRWTPVSTNVMPYTLCPVCPFILFEDTDSTNMAHRLYRCFEVP